MKSDSFSDKKLAEIYYKHDLEVLRKSAGLDVEMEKDAVVGGQWDIVEGWSEQSRYEIGKAEKDASDLYDAIDKGVLPWIRARW